MTIATNILPTVDFCGTELTRLMIGGNQFRGYSHFSEELNVKMREYYSVENAASTACSRAATELSFQWSMPIAQPGGNMHWIVQTAKPCIAYKILAASRKCGSEEEIRASFQYAFDHIKPGDIVNVGMFQKHLDQVAMNAKMVREVLGAA